MQITGRIEMIVDRTKKHRRTHILSSGAGALLSMFVTFIGFLPQPVRAAAPYGFELTIERNEHTATVLQGGKVLIVGGKSATGTALNSAEIVDAMNPSSTQPSVPGLQSPRTGHTATSLANGDVLVAGGNDGSAALNSTQIFDHSTNAWSAETSDLQHARSGHTATLLDNDHILIAGGDASGSAEIYGSAASVGPLNTPRSKHGAVRLNDGKVLIVGGIDNNGNALTTAELFDPSTSTFTPVATELAVPRVKPDLRLLPDGKVQVIGGANDGSFEMYDPDENNTKLGFNAKVEAVNATTNIDEVLNAQTRGAILFDGSVVPGGPLSDILNRNGYAMTEIAQPAVDGVPQASKVLISGGVSSTAETEHHSAYVVDGSPATITTNATDYAPGTDVYVDAKGWKPGETVDFMLHKVKADGVVVDWAQPVSWTTDENGELNGYAIYQPVAPDDIDAKFTLTAVGQESGFVAQTSFTDGANTKTIQVSTISPITVSVTAIQYTAAGDCTGANNSLGSFALTTSLSTITTINTNGKSVKLTAPASPTSPSGYTFSNWTSPTNGTATVVGGDSKVVCISGTNGNQTDTFVPNYVAAANVAPVASAVSISGTAEYGQLLTGIYTYSDADLDAQGTSTFRWLRNGSTVVGTNLTYTTVSADVGQTLTFEVTPVAATGLSPGTAVQSSAVLIGKAPSTVTVAALSVPYDGNPHSTTATVSGVGTGITQTVTWAYTGNCSAEPVNVADTPCTATATYAGDANHDGSSGFNTITITKAPSTVTVAALSVPYDGNPHSTTATVSGVGTGITQTVTWAYTGNCSAEPVYMTDTPCTATATYAGDANHDGSSGFNTITITTGFNFNGFLSPIGGSVENGNGGSFGDPLKAFKLGSTIPVKFSATWITSGAALTTGIHTLQAIKYSSTTESETAIDATPTDSATTGNQFRLTDGQWHFNLSTKTGFTKGTWLLQATLEDGSVHTVWITIKK
jgi:hypothetical protein